LRRAWLEGESLPDGFVNPLREETLHFRS